MAIDTEPFMVECQLAVEWLSKAVGVPTAFIWMERGYIGLRIGFNRHSILTNNSIIQPIALLNRISHWILPHYRH